MGPRTRSCSQQNTVGEAPPTDEQEERNVQAALAQTAIDEDARTVARDTLKRRAQLHNLRIVEKGGDGHCLQYSVQDQLRQQGIDGQTMQILRPAMAAFIGDKAQYFKQFLTDEEREQSRGEGSSPTYGTRMAMPGVGKSLSSLISSPQLQEGPHLPRSGSRREYAEVKRRLREHPHVTLCCLQWALIDPVALLHALVTWSRLLCYLEILVL